LVICIVYVWCVPKFEGAFRIQNSRCPELQEPTSVKVNGPNGVMTRNFRFTVPQRAMA
jgi:hypothetical protein